MGLGIDPWTESILLWEEMARNLFNPSQIAGNNIDPVDGILQELNSGHPDWNTIKADLSKIKGILEEMYSVGKNLHPARNPNYGDYLEKTIGQISGLMDDIGNPTEFRTAFNAFLVNIDEIWHDLLGG